MIEQDMYESALVDWNFWGNFRIDYIERDYDIGRLVSNRYALVLYGVRRAGKSWLAYGYLKRMIEGGLDPRETLIVNFEDPRLYGIRAEECLRILREYMELTNAKNPIIVLDEVQNVRGWEKFVRYLVENRRFRVIVTGSSSKLLSREYATVLTGRHIDVEVYPLSFREFLRFKGLEIRDEVDAIKNESRIRGLMREYVEYGGYPEVVLEEDTLVKKKLLQQYFYDILEKDVTRRYGIKKYSILLSLANIYLQNISNKVKYRKIAKTLKQHVSLIERYSQYLETARLFSFIKKFPYKIKEVERSLRKVYTIDVGLHYNLTLKTPKETGRILENIVYLHLARKNLKIHYYTTKAGKEIDFIIGDVKPTPVEVAYEVDEEHIRKILKALEELKSKNGTIVSWNEEDIIRKNGKTIRIIPAWKYLLNIDSKKAV